MSLYNLEPESDIYGFSNQKLTNPIQYLLSKVQNANNVKSIKSYSNDVVNSDRELKQVVKSKYNLFKQNEAQSVDGSGAKRFKFHRK